VTAAGDELAAIAVAALGPILLLLHVRIGLRLLGARLPASAVLARRRMSRGHSPAALRNGSVDLALAALRDPDWGMRLIVASQMGPTGDPRVVDALVILLNDADGYVREGAAIGLERQGDPRAVEPLRAMLRRGERDRAAKASAKRAIRVLKKQGSSTGRPTRR
jgi:HEAT repeat protein